MNSNSYFHKYFTLLYEFIFIQLNFNKFHLKMAYLFVNYIKIIIAICLLSQIECVSLKTKDDLQEFKGEQKQLICWFIYFKYSIFKYLKFQDPCSQIKCASNQICVSKDDFTASCILREQVETDPSFFFNKRSIETKTQLCGNLECRFGVCEALNETNFVCHCSKVIFLIKLKLIC